MIFAASKRMGPVSISEKTCYCKISWGLEAAAVWIVASLWNLTGTSEVLLQWYKISFYLNTQSIITALQPTLPYVLHILEYKPVNIMKRGRLVLAFRSIATHKIYRPHNYLHLLAEGPRQYCRCTRFLGSSMTKWQNVFYPLFKLCRKYFSNL